MASLPAGGPLEKLDSAAKTLGRKEAGLLLPPFMMRAFSLLSPHGQGFLLLQTRPKIRECIQKEAEERNVIYFKYNVYLYNIYYI